MSTENATRLISVAQLLNQAQAKVLEQTLIELSPPPATGIATAAEFDAAYGAAAPGAVLVLATAFTYPHAFTVDKAVTIRSQSSTTGRMTKTEPLPAFLGGLTVTADQVTLTAIAVQNSYHEGDLVVLLGRGVTLDRCRIVGDPGYGGKRGVAANGAQMVIRECYIDDVFLPGIETQGICSWDMGGGLTIENNYICAAGVGILFGGADASSQERMPHDVTIRRNTVTKNKSWYGGANVIKNALEFKACERATVEDNVLEGGGTSQGQGAYVVVCTVRNQDGHATWSAIRDITIANCTGGHASGVISFLGSDDVNPSGKVERVTMRDCAFEDIDPWNGTGGAGRLFFFDRAPDHVTLSGITVKGDHLAALGYFSGPPPTAMVLEKMTLPPSEYGWKIDGGSSGHDALQAYAPDATLDETIV